MESDSWNTVREMTQIITEMVFNEMLFEDEPFKGESVDRNASIGVKRD